MRDRIEHYNFYLNQSVCVRITTLVSDADISQCRIDPISRHPKPLQPYVDEVKTFIAVIITADEFCLEDMALNIFIYRSHGRKSSAGCSPSLTPCLALKTATSGNCMKIHRAGRATM